jgi:creatinine amidohydrolase/Fe(II)-dependent formamide hydrolase-like protein
MQSRLLIDLYTNIGTELARSGFTRLIFVNGHAPNGAVLGIAAYEIRERADMEIGVLEWWTTSDQIVKAIKGFSYGTHADEIETSLVMATEEGPLVDLKAAVVNSPTLEALTPAEAAMYQAKVPFTRTLDQRWVGTSGNMGDPTKASRDKGERIMQRAVEVGVQLLEALAEQLRQRAAHRSSPKRS